MPESVITAATLNAWQRPLAGSKLERIGRIAGGTVNGQHFPTVREVADGILASKPNGFAGISKADPADGTAGASDPAQQEVKEQIQEMTEEMHNRDKKS